MVRLEYKGALGTFAWSSEDGEYFGKIDNIGDLVTFTGIDHDELMGAFIEAVDDYIEICAEINKECAFSKEDDTKS